MQSIYRLLQKSGSLQMSFIHMNFYQKLINHYAFVIFTRKKYVANTIELNFFSESYFEHVNDIHSIIKDL